MIRVAAQPNWSCPILGSPRRFRRELTTIGRGIRKSARGCSICGQMNRADRYERPCAQSQETIGRDLVHLNHASRPEPRQSTACMGRSRTTGTNSLNCGRIFAVARGCWCRKLHVLDFLTRDSLIVQRNMKSGWEGVARPVLQSHRALNQCVEVLLHSS